ncbi:MAG: VCBS repeat-containing protein, partial [Kiritimatiellales bacterium]|nr:VCBS repeat-containing protein [Kiritimatiellales bacterium]
MHLRSIIPIGCILVLTATAGAGADKAERDFGFQPLEIYEFTHGASHLLVKDINSDGLDDIVFANNNVSRLEILLRLPATADQDHSLPELDERFKNIGIIVDQGLGAVRVTDLNNDTRPDLLTFGTALGLRLRSQHEDGSFGEPIPIFVKDPSSVTTIQTGDLNGDGLADILVCRQDQADILWNGGQQPFLARKTLTFSNDKSYHGVIADVNGDGNNDLVFYFNTLRFPIKVRYGRGNGSFGAGQPVDLPPKQYMDILEFDGAPPRIAMILRNRMALRLYGFTEKNQPVLLQTQETAPNRIGLEGTIAKAAPAWLANDFNGDGFDDMLVAAPELSRLHIYHGNEEGLDPEPERIDSLSDVSRVSRLANGDILVVSKKEKIAALHSRKDINRFPAILDTPGNVLAGCALESGNECWLVCKDDDNKLSLVRIEGTGDKVSAYPLEMENDPADLLVFKLPQGKTGMILAMPYDTPVMYLFANDSLTELTSESFRALTQQLKIENILLGAPGDGERVVVSQGPVVRAFEWKEDRYEVTRQFNPENARAELVASCRYRLLDGSEGTLLYDRNTGDLIWYADGSETWGKIHIPDAPQTI